MSMKQVINPIYFFLPFLFLMINAEVGFSQKNHIKFSLITLQKLGLSYERETSSKHSVLVHYKKYKVVYDAHKAFRNYNYKNNGARIMVEYRVYFTSKEKNKNRFYLGPNVSIGNHEISYEEIESTPFFAGPESNPELADGKTTLISNGIGLKLGYQYCRKRIVFDVGTNLTLNSPMLPIYQLELSNGELVDYKTDIIGFFPEFYVGLGFSF